MSTRGVYYMGALTTIKALLFLASNALCIGISVLG